MAAEGNIRVRVRDALLEQIASAAANETSPKNLALLAEAYAWALYPNNSHGGGAAAQAAEKS